MLRVQRSCTKVKKINFQNLSFLYTRKKQEIQGQAALKLPPMPKSSIDVTLSASEMKKYLAGRSKLSLSTSPNSLTAVGIDQQLHYSNEGQGSGVPPRASASSTPNMTPPPSTPETNSHSTSTNISTTEQQMIASDLGSPIDIIDR